MAIFFVLGFGYLLGRVSIGFFSVGSTAGSLLVALVVGTLAFELAGVRFQIPDLVGTIFLALFTYAIGLRVGPQFVEGLRREGAAAHHAGAGDDDHRVRHRLRRQPAVRPRAGLRARDSLGQQHHQRGHGRGDRSRGRRAVHAAGRGDAEQVKANIAAGYSLTYILSVLGIVLLVRNLPGMFGIDPVAAAKESEKKYGAKGHALPGTSEAFELGMPRGDVRVFQLANDAFVGRPVLRGVRDS